MTPKSMVSGMIADTRAYGFSGKSPYHFSSRYLRPCATSIENGRIRKIIELELNPVMTMQKTIRIVAIELREAKKPLVVENRPMSESAKIGRLIRGERNTLSRLFCQEKTGAKPLMMLFQKVLGRKAR